ncbi:hypothetical protein [Pseudoalteromonas luteoviolacea]|uniref:hypothetical protein n=1 Tax=Pseudoalteromonas luteoviolacea TaxID=43657 RepID=UPI0012DAB21F|nr:hypothetical protein [Pseudoalteromonas luteoviolacea]
MGKKTKLTTIKDKLSKAHGFLVSIFCSKTVNFNSFDITIKQVMIEFNYGGMHAACNTFLQGRDIGKHSINDVILVEDNLTGEQADYIAGFNDEPNCIVRIKAILKAPTKEVIYESDFLEGSKPSLINANGRRVKMKKIERRKILKCS